MGHMKFLAWFRLSINIRWKIWFGLGERGEGFQNSIEPHFTSIDIFVSHTFIIGREYFLVLQALSISTQPGPGPGSRVSQIFWNTSLYSHMGRGTYNAEKMLDYLCDTTCSSPSCRAPTPPNRLSTRRQDRVTMIQTTFPLPPSSRLGLTALYSQ